MSSEHILQTILESTHGECSDMSLMGVWGYTNCNKSAKFSENIESSAIQRQRQERRLKVQVWRWWH